VVTLRDSIEVTRERGERRGKLVLWVGRKGWREIATLWEQVVLCGWGCFVWVVYWDSLDYDGVLFFLPEGGGGGLRGWVVIVVGGVSWWLLVCFVWCGEGTDRPCGV